MNLGRMPNDRFFTQSGVAENCCQILEHNKERIVQFFNARCFVPPMILHETVVDVKHFNLQKTRLTIHLSQSNFENPFLNKGRLGDE